MNHSLEKIFTLPEFGVGAGLCFLGIDSTRIQHVFSTFLYFFAFFRIFLVFFVFASKIRQLLITSEVLSLRAADPFYKPNPKGILSQCRYTDTKPCSSLKPSAPKNKPFQTCCPFAPPTPFYKPNPKGILSE
jgi:hypothetical protein